MVRLIAVLLLASLAMTTLSAETNVLRNRKMLWDGFSGECEPGTCVEPAVAADEPISLGWLVGHT